jgi:hypothetical protein
MKGQWCTALARRRVTAQMVGMPVDPSPLLSRIPIVPVLTIERVEHAMPLARALVAGGLPLARAEAIEAGDFSRITSFARAAAGLRR